MNTAVILAAGPGRGAWPYCGLRQKVTLPVAHTPIVRRLASQLSAVGIRDIVVVVGACDGAVRACLDDMPGVRFVTQSAPDGCGDAALVGLASVEAERALVCYGDIVTTAANIAALVETDKDGASPISILGVGSVPGLPVWDSVEVNASGEVEGLWNKGGLEHPRFGGMVVAPVAALCHALELSPGYVDNVGVGAMPRAENSLAAGLNRLCQREGGARCIPGHDPLVDVNRPWDLVEANRLANRDFFGKHSGVVLGEGAHIDESVSIPGDAVVVLGPGARLGKGVIVEGDLALGAHAAATSGAILGTRAHLGARARVREYARIHNDAILGAGCTAGHCAEFSGVALEGALFWHYCCVTAVVGAQSDIGAATCCGTWRFDDGVREQRVGEHDERPPWHGALAFLGDRTRTGVNVTINPGVRIGSHSCIGPGTILYDDVADGQLVTVRQELAMKPWGSERYPW